MLTLHDLAPVLDVALAAEGLKDPELPISVLVATGWTEWQPESTGMTEERSWRHAGPPDEGSSGGYAWTTASQGGGVILGLIVEAPSHAAARALHGAIRDRITSERRLLDVESDSTWSNWSDGHRTVRLALHEGSNEPGKSIPPTVQLSFEPADTGEQEG